MVYIDMISLFLKVTLWQSNVSCDLRSLCSSLSPGAIALIVGVNWGYCFVGTTVLVAVVLGTVVDGTVDGTVEGTVVEGTVVEGTVVEGTARYCCW